MVAAAMVLGGVAALSSLAGCYVYTDPAPPVSRVDYAYEPVYYEGRVVYYDDTGAPYVVVDDGSPYYVPRTYVQYGFYVNHYHRYGPGYHRWVRTHHHGPVRHHRRH